MSAEPKVCAVCGRRFAWRKKWERDWDHVRHCSDACRKRGLRPEDAQLEAALLALLAAQPRATPEAAAAQVWGATWADAHRAERLEAAKAAARRLAEAGKLSVWVQGRKLPPSQAAGPAWELRRP
jgi:hypothetical protein